VRIKPQIIVIAEASDDGIHKGRIGLFIGEVGEFALQGADDSLPLLAGGRHKQGSHLLHHGVKVYWRYGEIKGLALCCGHLIGLLMPALCIQAALLQYYLPSRT
jgi:hypothetical protein